MASDNQSETVSGPSNPSIPYDVPTSARGYGWMLGGKDNYEIDRKFILSTVPSFPEVVDICRQNRQFLYRAVRHLTREHGIRQFIDMGCGLPTDNNVHQVAQRFAPDARVVYVDIDPIVLAHGRALLADDSSTTVIMGDMRDQDAILKNPDVTRLIDFDEPVATLFLSVGHHLVDADDPRRVLRTIIDRAAPGSFVGFSQVICEDPVRGAAMTEHIAGGGVPWQTRTPAEVDVLLEGLEPVEPGVVNLVDWRPDPDQPALEPVDPDLEPYLGVTDANKGIYEYGGVLRKP
ncbi:MULTISPECIES: SAM-dependent methyltransferase [unclassified Streptomyces]|uniref:SAM-dependent methyltransferase n=1 Tax=unclassified Streptomyces TaxID=2593676 RepID=UPI002286C56B|nr:SAM-dependent methyltransferase [Streptomyces sp. Je 1-369]WAL93431.1 SAM-dependent methyltransferase [Streptomyces sp. Je 1-369]